MPSKKISRTNEDIRLCLSNLLRDIKDPRLHQGLISVTAVNTSPDLKYCHVFVSVLGLESEKEFMRGLRSATGYLRRELGRRVQMRNVPELTFELDKSMEYGAHISQLISNLDIKEETDEASDNPSDG